MLHLPEAELFRLPSSSPHSKEVRGVPGTPPGNYGPGPAPCQYGLDTLPDQSNAVLRFGNRDELSSRGAYLLGHVEAVEEAGTAKVWVMIVAPPLSGRQLWFDALRDLEGV
jgi:hypothetical protein